MLGKMRIIVSENKLDKSTKDYIIYMSNDSNRKEGDGY